MPPEIEQSGDHSSAAQPTARVLSSLMRGERAEVAGFDGPLDRIERLRELGFIEGARIHVRHFSPFGGDPVAVELDGALIALRRSEAALVLVTQRP